MLDTADWIAKENQSHMGTYNRFPIVFAKARGSKLWDIDGKEYTDFLAGIGVLNLGHCPEKIVTAFCSQARELGHISNLFYNRPQIELAEKLSSIAGGRCFFANSGAEANEGAIKLARRWGRDNFSPAKSKIVSALNSFHGRTLATLAATGQPDKNQLFAPLPAGFEHVDFNDIDQLSKAVDDTTCAVILEVVQGESGVWPAEEDYLRAARRFCDEQGALLIFDEIQTGMGRTGRFLAFERFGVKPDIFTLAKSLAGGFPIGAIVAAEEISACLKPGEHGSTFGGGPAVCSAALATMETLEADSLIEKADSLGRYFVDRLLSLSREGDKIEDVRGVGLMIGITLAEPNARRTVVELLEKGFITVNVGESVIRFLPPLIISKREIDDLVEALQPVLGGV